MDLKDVQENWTRFGETDPFWAVLAWPGMEAGRWDPDAFFATGQEEIAQVMADLAALDLHPDRHTALDFGCGVGRLTQALAQYFDIVHGVDISPPMLELAETLNRQGDRCRFHLNPNPDLSLFADATFDFVYSNITLQHIPPRYARGYIREFLRVLKPGGVAVFQVPSRPHGLVQRLLQPIKPTRLWRGYQRLRYGQQPVMNMYGLPRRQVVDLVTRHGGEIVEIRSDSSADAAWESYRYTILKA